MYKIQGSDQKEYGPVSAEQIKKWISEGRVNAQTPVWSETSANWKPLSTYPEFASLVAPDPQPVYGQTAFASPQQPKANTFATIGLVMGILSLPMLCCCYGFPFNILGIIFSSIALSQIKKSGGTQTGRGMAIAGIALSIVSLVLLVVVIVLGVALGWEDIARDLKKF
jgi:hypothetical protein